MSKRPVHTVPHGDGWASRLRPGGQKPSRPRPKLKPLVATPLGVSTQSTSPIGRTGRLASATATAMFPIRRGTHADAPAVNRGRTHRPVASTGASK